VNPEQLNQAISSYISTERSRLEALASFNCSVFNKLTFDKSEISTQNCDCWTEQLRAERTDRGPVLYYFTLLNDIDPFAICDVITRMKMSPGKSERALPKVNIKNVDNGSKVLYIGKTEKGFSRRFKEHLGFGSSSTFALNIIHWRTDLQITLELNYTCIDNSQLQNLESVESALHLLAKPILGRMGR
jgi:hypothetical protein